MRRTVANVVLMNMHVIQVKDAIRFINTVITKQIVVTILMKWHVVS